MRVNFLQIRPRHSWKHFKTVSQELLSRGQIASTSAKHSVNSHVLWVSLWLVTSVGRIVSSHFLNAFEIYSSCCVNQWFISFSCCGCSTAYLSIHLLDICTVSILGDQEDSCFEHLSTYFCVNWWKNKHRNQWNSIERPETYPHKYSQMIFLKIIFGCAGSL